MAEDTAAGGVSERVILFLLGAIQFVNVLEFMMVMPLGPDFAKGLGIPSTDVGLVAAAYTAAAAVSGLAGALFLDRFDRKKGLFVAMIGLTVATFAGGLAGSRETLLVARACAGAFGGPATSLAMSILADVFPAERRGRAMGAVMGAFAVASVVGVPIALELARIGTWRAPFVAVGLMGLAVSVAAVSLLPSMTGHLVGRAAPGSVAEELRTMIVALGQMASRRIVLLSWAASFTLFVGAFVLVPNIAAYLQGNLHYPREDLWRLYLSGGVVSLFMTRIVGALVDRFGAGRVNLVGVALFLATVWGGFGVNPPIMPVSWLFVLFMTAMTFRNMAINTQASRVPSPDERARFGSVQSTVQHVAASVAAVLSSYLLVEQPDTSLTGMRTVLVISTAFNVLLVPLALVIERQLRIADRSTSASISTGGASQGPSSTVSP